MTVMLHIVLSMVGVLRLVHLCGVFLLATLLYSQKVNRLVVRFSQVNILWSFVKNHKKKKILVFMQSCKQVKYIYEIFCR
jgi:hypothetical protein